MPSCAQFVRVSATSRAFQLIPGQVGGKKRKKRCVCVPVRLAKPSQRSQKERAVSKLGYRGEAAYVQRKRSWVKKEDVWFCGGFGILAGLLLTAQTGGGLRQLEIRSEGGRRIPQGTPPRSAETQSSFLVGGGRNCP